MKRNKCAHCQFPRARRQKEECSCRFVECAPVRQCQAACSNNSQRRYRPSSPQFPCGHKEKGIEQIELLLKSNAPSVEQRIKFCVNFEVSSLAPEKNV